MVPEQLPEREVTVHLPPSPPYIDPGSLLLGERLCRLEMKLDALTRLAHRIARVSASTHALAVHTNARVEQIAQALEIGREPGSMTLHASTPTQE